MFGKSKSSELQSPLEKIKTMSKMGIGEKEIVKQLKSEGYSFSQIEQAMMMAMKEGVEAQQQQQFPQATPPKIEGKTDMNLSWPRLERPEELFPQAAEQDELAPEVAMEDLVENITYEKFEKYNKELKDLGDKISGFHDELNQIKEEASKTTVTEIPKDLEDRIDTMEARINGLEKAFRQILPTISKSVEELRSTIDQIKKTPVSAQTTSGVPKQHEYQQYYPNVPLFPTKTISNDKPVEESKPENKKPVEQEA